MREKRDGQKERERRGRNREREEERGRDNFVKREVKEGCKGGGSARERERERVGGRDRDFTCLSLCPGRFENLVRNFPKLF